MGDVVPPKLLCQTSARHGEDLASRIGNVRRVHPRQDVFATVVRLDVDVGELDLLRLLVTQQETLVQFPWVVSFDSHCHSLAGHCGLIGHSLEGYSLRDLFYTLHALALFFDALGDFASDFC